MRRFNPMRDVPDPNERHRRAADQKVPLTVRVLVEETLQFIHTYFPDVMQGGMFIRTETPDSLVLGTRVQLRFLGSSGDCLFAGSGVVAWVQRGETERGLGVQFLRLEPESHNAYRAMLRLKRELDGQRRPQVFDQPPAEEWSDMPTRQVGQSRETMASVSRTTRKPRVTPQHSIRAARRSRRVAPPPPPPQRLPPPPPPPRRASASLQSGDFSEKVIVPIEDLPKRR